VGDIALDLFWRVFHCPPADSGAGGRHAPGGSTAAGAGVTPTGGTPLSPTPSPAKAAPSPAGGTSGAPAGVDGLVPLPAAAVSSAEAMFKEIITGYYNKGHRLAYTDRIIANVKAGVAVPRMYKLLWQLVESYYPNASGGDLTRVAYVALLQSHGLLGIVLDDVVRYKELAAEAARAAGVVTCVRVPDTRTVADVHIGKLTAEDVAAGMGVRADGARVDLNAMQPVRGEAQTHREQVQARLHFLKLLLQQSNDTLSYAQLRDLFDALYVRALTRQERKLFLEFLTHATSVAGAGTFFTAAAGEQFLLRHVLPRDDAPAGPDGSATVGLRTSSRDVGTPGTLFLPYATSAAADAEGMSKAGFDVLRGFILDMCSQRGLLDRVSESEVELRAAPEAVPGLEHVWRVAMLAEDDAVASDAITLLNMLFTQFSDAFHGGPPGTEDDDSLPPSARQQRAATQRHAIVSGYVNRCVDRLVASVQAAGGAEAAGRDHLRQVSRLLLLLHRLLDGSDVRGHGLVLRPHAARTRGAAMRLKISNLLPVTGDVAASLFPQTFGVTAYAGTTLWELRTAIAARGAVLPGRLTLSR
jgi:hypothetical protein